MNNAFAPRKSKDRNVRFSEFASHTTSHITELESVQSSVDILLQHKLPKARQRPNVVTQDYTPRGRKFGGYARRGEGVTMASYRFPEVTFAIHSLAATRLSGFAHEPYLLPNSTQPCLCQYIRTKQSQYDMAHCLRQFYRWKAVDRITSRFTSSTFA